ncbi:hypothetical protein B0H67DRAFT_647266 [Lasiosphaeris hirsuta]|uniref:Nephrocystin 3-like N-terminal domain-containing protein n=1 Tax=Lasiosphaeris hirsuta TaxID=260670 RepID=A0AA40DU49_9PEZI|nr:hypothetical protein B0H67DRAFT_647266 [Lasiosphaeris hirsuta]
MHGIRRKHVSLLDRRKKTTRGKARPCCSVASYTSWGELLSPMDGYNYNLACFFCQATDSRVNNATAVLRDLVYMLVCQQPSLVSHIRKRHDNAGKTVFEDANTWVALSDIFSNILHDNTLKTTYLVIDALDECTTILSQLLTLIAKKLPKSSRVKWISKDVDICKRILAVTTIVHQPLPLRELAILVDVPKLISDEPRFLKRIIQLCGSFLALREQAVYFVHQSAKDFLLGTASNEEPKMAFSWVLPSGTSLEGMSAVLARDMYRLGNLRASIDSAQVPNPDPLTTVRYSCVYWIYHLCGSVCSTNAGSNNLLEDDGDVYEFLKTKYLCWLVRAMPAGVIATTRLEALLRVRTNWSGALSSSRPRCTWICTVFQIDRRASPVSKTHTSALVLALTGSLIRKLFEAEAPD